MGTSESTFIETDLFLKDRIIFLIVYFFHLKEQTCTILVCHCALGFPINYEWPPSLRQTSILLIAKRSKYQGCNRQKLIKVFILPLTFYFECSVCMHAKALQSKPILCYPMDCNPPGSSVHGVLQAGILEWVAMPFSSGILLTEGSNPHLLRLLHFRQVLYCWATVEALLMRSSKFTLSSLLGSEWFQLSEGPMSSLIKC